FGRIGAMVGTLVAGIPGRPQANAAEPSPSGGELRIQHRGYSIPEPQVGGTHDAGGDPPRAILAGGTHGGNTVDELDLAHGAHGFWPVGFEHRPTLDEPRRPDFVAAPYIRQNLIEQIARGDACGPEIPQMMMGVTNRQVGLKGSLDYQREPVSIRCW